MENEVLQPGISYPASNEGRGSHQATAFSLQQIPPSSSPLEDYQFMSLGFRAIIHVTGSDFFITVTRKRQLPNKAFKILEMIREKILS